MKNTQTMKDFFRNNWLIILIAAQPLLDTLAFWTQNFVATAAGYIRLAVMVGLPLYLLFTLKKKGKFIASMLVIGGFCAAHVLNCWRVGYVSPFIDIEYMARIAQMPVLAICFAYLIKDEKTKDQAFRGIYWAAGITLLCLVLSLITGTWNSTYGGKTGISGWVIDDNRCANSIIFVTLAVFAVLYAYKMEKKAVQVGILTVTALVLVANSTRACYLGLFCIFLGYIVFTVVGAKLKGERVKKAFVLALAALAVLSAAAYPITPRAQVDDAKAAAAQSNQNGFDEKIEELGYDLSLMSNEEKLKVPEVFAAYKEYYQSIIAPVIPHMFDRFGMERVLEKYDFITDAQKLIDVRTMKTTYASLNWDECDTLTRLVGFEPTRQFIDGFYDMENDWSALFYYTGYIGFALYVLFVLYFVYLTVRRLKRDFKGSFTEENIALGICLMLQLALAQFSGAIIRRPNVSIYMALVLALIYYKTVTLPIAGEERSVT